MSRLRFAACICSVYCSVHHAFGDDLESIASVSNDVKSPLPAVDTLSQFVLEDGLRIELAAREPHVIDPVAIRFDERGRMWVAEMRDYPLGIDEKRPSKSRIKVLEDRDGDGYFETATVFADELFYATGVQPWMGGVFVTMAGEIAYMKDIDGDGRADTRKTWFSGFTQDRAQHHPNDPRFGLDNYLYVSNGQRGGTLFDPQQSGGPHVSIRGKDIRFDPRTRQLETISGVSEHGLTFDDFGNRFNCTSRVPVRHVVLEDRYLRRNPQAAIPAVLHEVAKSHSESRLFPIAKSWTTLHAHTGQFTAACGVEVFRGDALPDEYYGNVFVCEPTGHLVHREILTPNGATFTSRPARDGIEFLASRDSWFRPVNLETGADGSLYVVDMYRAVIEEPRWMPPELRNRPDLLDGHHHGRIYRVTAASAKPVQQVDFSKLSDSELVAQLRQKNAFRRHTAARMLMERGNRDIEAELRQMAVDVQQPLAQIHALWLLNGLGMLTDDLVTKSLIAPDPRVREQAVVLSEQRFDRSPSLLESVLRLCDDEDPRVRFQVLLSVAPLNDASHSSQISLAADLGIDDPWTRWATMIAAGKQAPSIAASYFRRVAQSKKIADSNELAFLSDMFSLAGATASQPECVTLFRELLQASQRDVLPNSRHVGYLAYVALSAALARKNIVVEELIKQHVSQGQDDTQSLAAFRHKARQDAHERENVPESLRLAAIDVLAYSPKDEQLLTTLAFDEDSQAVRLRALAALGRFANLAPWRKALDRFPNETPAVRTAILDAVLSRTDRALLLLDSMESQNIRTSELDRTRTNQLLNHQDADLRNRAGELLTSVTSTDREKVLADYQVVVTMKSDPYRGRVIFEKNCAGCHRVAGLGVDVAPDISDMVRKTTEQILTDILQPNREVNTNYVGYNVLTSDGQVLNGILASETTTTITIKQLQGKSSTLLRQEVEELRSTGLSLMPVGLEKNISPQKMADLIGFLKQWRFLEGNSLPVAD